MFKNIIKITITFLLSFALFSCGEEKIESKNLEQTQIEFKTDENLTIGKLKNGLTYYIYPNKKPKDNASLNLVVKVGSLMENDNEKGIAHFMEHMAFNGTKKYAKNDMIKYLQSIGLNFGGDLNAYTTFDRTVFELSIPTKEKDLEDGIEVLSEWARNATLETSEINAEKNVVLEEWRLSQGLTQRLWDVQKKALFGSSRYHDRFPIGEPEIIKGATHDLVKNFYKTWYQPHNMAIIAVGDFKAQDVENLIKKYFNYENETNFKPKDYKLNDLKNNYVVFTDPELRYTNFSIIKMDKFNVVNDKKTLRKKLIDDILVGIINSRLNNLTLSKDSPIYAGGMDIDMMTKNQEFIDFTIQIKEDKLNEGINLLNSFMINTKNNGVSKLEFDLEKESLIKDMENLVTNRASIENEIYADEIVDLIMYDNAFIDVNDELNLYKEIIPTIDISEINDRIAQIISYESLYFLTGNSKIDINNHKLEKIVKKSLTNVKEQNFEIKNIKLQTKELNKVNIPKIENNSVILNNSIKVDLKATDFDKDKIIIKLFKQEGSSIDSYENYLNSIYASQIIEDSCPSNLNPKDKESFMKTKNFNVKPYITHYEQGFNIITDKENLNNALDYMTALIYMPKIDDDVFSNTLINIKESIKNRNNSPRVLFSDEIIKTYTGNNKYFMPLTLNDLNHITKDKMMAEYKSKFNNFYGYNLIIVGSIKDIDVNDILSKYFATLPSHKNDLKAQEIKINVPEDIVFKEVKKGIDKKSTVAIIFPYKGEYNFKEKTLYSGFAEVLDIALIENIREKIGGVYGISAYPDLSPNNFGQNKLMIYYSLDPNRKDEIEKKVIETINDLLNKNIDNAKINSVVKNYEINYPIMRSENSFWVRYLYNKDTIKDYKLATPNEYKELMTMKHLQDYNKKGIDLKNYIVITLSPEAFE